eukprot:2763538-Prymnesium_polylepis.1
MLGRSAVDAATDASKGWARVNASRAATPAALQDETQIAHSSLPVHRRLLLERDLKLSRQRLCKRRLCSGLSSHGIHRIRRRRR